MQKILRRVFLLLVWQFLVNICCLLVLLFCFPNQIVLWTCICLWSSSSSFFLLCCHHHGGWASHCCLQLVLPLDCSTFSDSCHMMGQATWHSQAVRRTGMNKNHPALFSVSRKFHIHHEKPLHFHVSVVSCLVSLVGVSEDSCESWWRWNLRENILFRDLGRSQ